jgi:hypothetical protein
MLVKARHTITKSARVEKTAAAAAEGADDAATSTAAAHPHTRPENVLDYLADNGPYPPYVYDALGETFTQAKLGQLLMS